MITDNPLPRIARIDTNSDNTNNTKALKPPGGSTGKASYSLDREHADTSSEVMTRRVWLRFVDTGKVTRLYLSKSFRDSLSLVGFVSGDDDRSEAERESGVSNEASTSLARGTAPASVCRGESTSINGADSFHCAFEIAKDSDGVLYRSP